MDGFREARKILLPLEKRRINELIHVKCLQQFLAPSKGLNKCELFPLLLLAVSVLSEGRSQVVLGSCDTPGPGWACTSCHPRSRDNPKRLCDRSHFMDRELQLSAGLVGGGL